MAVVRLRIELPSHDSEAADPVACAGYPMDWESGLQAALAVHEESNKLAAKAKAVQDKVAVQNRSLAAAFVQVSPPVVWPL